LTHKKRKSLLHRSAAAGIASATSRSSRSDTRLPAGHAFFSFLIQLLL
jgi:hypothetical protein